MDSIEEIKDGNSLEFGGTSSQDVASCMEVLDVVLCRPHAIVASTVVADKVSGEPELTQDAVHTVAAVLGIKNVTAVAEGATLAELGMDSLMGAEMRRALERDHGIVLTLEEIRALTFGRLREVAPLPRRPPSADGNYRQPSEPCSQFHYEIRLNGLDKSKSKMPPEGVHL